MRKPERKLTPDQLERRLEAGAVRREQTRRKILTAAYELFAEHGREAPTIDDIIARADVGRGTFYAHFESREEVFSLVSNEIVADTLSLIIQTRKEDASPPERISTAFRQCLRALTAKPTNGMIVLRIFYSSKIISNNVSEYIMVQYRAGVEEGWFSLKNPQLFLDLSLGCTMAALRAVLVGGQAPSYIDDIAYALLKGIGVEDSLARDIASSEMERSPTG